ncbi:MAG TPA: regulatory protein RecX [Clostridiaceae bacterium]|jgi:regulatory protein|nr:regulatory protein RecX [Clostridiaceae bacterium]
MRITSIEKGNQKDPVYKIYIDNEYSFSIPEEDYFKFNLYEKDEVSEEEIKIIKNAANFSAAKSKAFVYLSYKFRTEKEIRLKLSDNGFNSDVIEKVLNELKSEGYINDSLYVRKYLHDRRKLNPKSKRMLMVELRKKGINKELIFEGLEELKLDNIIIAEELVRKKFKDIDISQKKIERKVFQFLQYRGFNAGEIRTVIRKLVDNNKME